MLRGNGELTILNRLRFKFELYGWPLWTGSYPNFPHCRSAPEQLIEGSGYRQLTLHDLPKHQLAAGGSFGDGLPVGLLHDGR